MPCGSAYRVMAVWTSCVRKARAERLSTVVMSKASRALLAPARHLLCPTDEFRLHPPAPDRKGATMYRMPCRACGRRVGVNTEICPSCGVRWPTHSMRDLLVEPRQTEPVYYRRNALGWTAELLFVVFNVLMAGWLIGAWRVGPHNIIFDAAQRA